MKNIDPTKTKHNMAGTEGTGQYVGIASTSRGAIAVREFSPGLFRVRVEPSSEKGATVIGKSLTRDHGWKQPGDSGQNRFSKTGTASELPAIIKAATDALGVGELKTTDLDLAAALVAVAAATGVKATTKKGKSTTFAKIVSAAK